MADVPGTSDALAAGPGGCLKADDILHVLRDRVALLPGTRDRYGRPVVIFPSRDSNASPVNSDHVRNALLYLHSVAEEEARQRGFVVLIDMRTGTSTSTAKIMLKAVEALSDMNGTRIGAVWVLKPREFLDRKKAQLALGGQLSKGIDIQFLTLEQLHSLVDPGQLPRGDEFRGSLPYDHDEWLETRLELERWVWRTAEAARTLERQRRAMADSAAPVDLATAQEAIDRHAALQRIIVGVPILQIESEANAVAERIRQSKGGVDGRQPNPDLNAALPHLTNLVASVASRKDEVYALWDTRRQELGRLYQLKLFDQDADKMFHWMRNQSEQLAEQLSNIGYNEREADAQRVQLEQLCATLKGNEASLASMVGLASRLRNGDTAAAAAAAASGDGVAAKRAKDIERAAALIDNEWQQLRGLVSKRRELLMHAAAFHRAMHTYFSSLEGWQAAPGVDPDSLRDRPLEEVDAAVDRHERFFAGVEEVFAEACDRHAQLKRLLRETQQAETECAVHVEQQFVQLNRAHGELKKRWKQRSYRITCYKAFLVFQTDTQRVVAWLDDHGEPYLSRNASIGRTLQEARDLQAQQIKFCQIAESTYSNANRLFEVAAEIVESAVCPPDKMAVIVDGLRARVTAFWERVESRHQLLNGAVLFLTHYGELTAHYTRLEERYSNMMAEIGREACEAAKQRWIDDSDQTNQAYSTVIAEGEQLLRHLRREIDGGPTRLQQQQLTELGVAVEMIEDNVQKIHMRQSRVASAWQAQREALSVALSYANIERECHQLTIQMKSWRTEMAAIQQVSDALVQRADQVLPAHVDNMNQVREATRRTQKKIGQLRQAIEAQRLAEFRLKNGEVLLVLLEKHREALMAQERDVMEQAVLAREQIEAAAALAVSRRAAKEVVSVIDKEAELYIQSWQIPSTQDEAHAEHDKLMRYRQDVDQLNRRAAERFRDAMNSAYSYPGCDRAAVAELNEDVMRVWRRFIGLIDEREKLVKAAIPYYKTMKSINPLIDQLEQEYGKDSTKTGGDWCLRLTPDVAGEPRITEIAQLLVKHGGYRDRFTKGCAYAFKTSETFLKFIRRFEHTKPGGAARKYEQLVRISMDKLRQRESKILELWSIKKRQLERCQQYIVIDETVKQVLAWIAGEGEKRLAAADPRRSSSSARSRDQLVDDFAEFKIAVRVQRSSIQTVLGVAEQEAGVPDQLHGAAIKQLMTAVRQRFADFSNKVCELETAIQMTLGRPANANAVGSAATSAAAAKVGKTRDELSLDRLSDPTVDASKAIGDASAKQSTAAEDELRRKLRDPMAELVRSEADYVEHLRKCAQVYVAAYDADAKTGALPAPLRDQRRQLFCNLEDILEFHENTFLRELRKYEHEPANVGHCFNIWLGPLREQYTEYCVNKEQHNALLTQPAVVEYFNGVRERAGLEPARDVGSFLIQPVQRITRYQLMMQQILRHCTAGDGWKDAYEVVTSIPRRVNDLIHLNALDYDRVKGSDLFGDFVQQDAMQVWEPKSYFKKCKDRQLFLFERAIILAKRLDASVGGERSSFEGSARYVVKGRPIMLDEVAVVEHIEAGDKAKFGLRVGPPTTNENRWDLRASSEAVKLAWVKMLRQLVQDLLRIRLEGVGDALSLAGSAGTTPSSNAVSVDASSVRSMQTIGSDSLQQQQRQNRLSRDSCGSLPSTGSGGGGNGHHQILEPLNKDEKPQYVRVKTTDGRTGLLPAGILAIGADKSETTEMSSGSRTTDRPTFDDPGPPTATTTTTTTANGRGGSSAANGQINVPIISVQEPVPSSVLSAPAAAHANSVDSGSGPSTSRTTTTTTTTTAATTSNRQGSTEETTLPPPMDALNSALSSVPADGEDGQNGSNNNNNNNNGTTSAAENDNDKAGDSKSPQEAARMKRQYVLMELIETEGDYVRDLTSVVDGYIANLESIDLPPDLVGKDKIIFANIAQIQEFHKNTFLKELEKAATDYEAAGHAFVKFERRLHTLYVKYCQNKPKSDYLVSQESFEQFFAETKQKLGHRVALNDLLIKPVQRIMKYQLLLKDVMKFTERAGDRTDVIKKALDVMHVVPKACDDMMQVGRLQNFDGNLTAQGKLLHQGTLQISESAGGGGAAAAATQKPKERRIFLFEQSAIVADLIPPRNQFTQPTYIFKNQIMVNKMVLESTVAGDEQPPLRFAVRTSDPANTTTFLGVCASPEERNEWVAKISSVLDQQKTLLAALVDPKRYQSSLSGGVGNLNLGGDAKSASGSSSATSSSKTASGIPKPASSAQKTTAAQGSTSGSSKLFGFGKKSSTKSPTSP